MARPGAAFDSASRTRPALRPPAGELLKAPVVHRVGRQGQSPRLSHLLHGSSGVNRYLSPAIECNSVSRYIRADGTVFVQVSVQVEESLKETAQAMGVNLTATFREALEEKVGAIGP